MFYRFSILFSLCLLCLQGCGTIKIAPEFFKTEAGNDRYPVASSGFYRAASPYTCGKKAAQVAKAKFGKSQPATILLFESLPEKTETELLRGIREELGATLPVFGLSVTQSYVTHPRAGSLVEHPYSPTAGVGLCIFSDQVHISALYADRTSPRKTAMTLARMAADQKPDVILWLALKDDSTREFYRDFLDALPDYARNRLPLFGMSSNTEKNRLYFGHQVLNSGGVFLLIRGGFEVDYQNYYSFLPEKDFYQVAETNPQGQITQLQELRPYGLNKAAEVKITLDQSQHWLVQAPSQQAPMLWKKESTEAWSGFRKDDKLRAASFMTDLEEEDRLQYRLKKLKQLSHKDSLFALGFFSERNIPTYSNDALDEATRLKNDFPNLPILGAFSWAEIAPQNSVNGPAEVIFQQSSSLWLVFRPKKIPAE